MQVRIANADHLDADDPSIRTTYHFTSSLSQKLQACQRQQNRRPTSAPKKPQPFGVQKERLCQRRGEGQASPQESEAPKARLGVEDLLRRCYKGGKRRQQSLQQFLTLASQGRIRPRRRTQGASQRRRLRRKNVSLRCKSQRSHVKRPGWSPPNCQSTRPSNRPSQGPLSHLACRLRRHQAPVPART